MPKPISAPVAAEVRQDVESESALVYKAKQAISTCNWTVGECASQWTDRWAKGRTDADFGAAVGLSGDQVYQRRRVFDRFGETDLNRFLSWTHFVVALNWDDADACLDWACVNQATVAEMKAWRSAQNGHESETDLNRNLPNSDDPFGDDSDPFGEGEGAGTDSSTEIGTEAAGEDDGTEAGGTETEQEQPTRPPRNGTEASGGHSKPKPPADPFATQKSKTVKTIEALMRAIDDLNGLRKIRQRDAMIEALGKMIEAVKACK